MISEKLRGVLTASITPVAENGALDCEAVARLVKYYRQSGLRGALFPSSTGESFALTAKERVALVRVAAHAASDDFSILGNCSEHNWKDALRNARAMADAGADVAVCMPPQFLAYSQEELRAYFYTIADQSPIPLLVYNHMTRLPNKVGLELLGELAKHENIVGIKDTHNDPNRMLQIYAQGVQKDFAILCGGDGVAAYAALLDMEMLNALSAVKPRLFLNLYAAGRAGDLALAARYQREVDKLMGLFSALRGGLASSTLFAQAIKAALSLQGLCGTASVQMGYPLEADGLARVREILVSVQEELA